MADGIIFRTTDGARWGAAGGLGTGGNLTPLQFDENMWELLTRIQALETDPPEAVSVNGFTVLGSQFQVNMSDGSTRGPYDLPIATFRDMGEWVNAMELEVLDFFSVPHRGFYRTLIAHTTPDAPAEFDPAAVDEDSGSPTFGEPLYQLVFGEDTYIYVVGFFFPNKPGLGVEDGAALAGHVFVHEVTAEVGLPGSKAYLKVDPAIDMELVIQHNDVTVGAVHFVAGSNVGTFELDDEVIFEVGDRLTILKPTDGVDADAKELSVSLNLLREVSA